MSKPMTQIQIETAVHQIDGYYTRSSWKDEKEATFNKAKAEFDRTAEEWERAKRTSDPDYKPKAKESDDDGKWEDVRDKYLVTD